MDRWDGRRELDVRFRAGSTIRRSPAPLRAWASERVGTSPTVRPLDNDMRSSMTRNSELGKSPNKSRAGLREWVGLAVLALPCLLYSMDLTVLNLAVPELSRDLRPNSTELLWIVDI